MKWKNERAHNFVCVLYPQEDKSHAEAEKKIKSQYSYACIVHDKFSDEEIAEFNEKKRKRLEKQQAQEKAPAFGKDSSDDDFDIDEFDGENISVQEPKPHVHYIIHHQDNVWITQIANSIGLGNQKERIWKAKSKDRALLYLIHRNNPEKYQYDIADVKGDMQVRLAKLINADERSEEEACLSLFDFIKYSENELTMTEIIYYALDNGLYSHLRRSSRLVECAIKEHNSILFAFRKRGENETPLSHESAKREKDNRRKRELELERKLYEERAARENERRAELERKSIETLQMQLDYMKTLGSETFE